MAEPIKYIRRLTIALMISGAINLGLLAMVFYWTMYESPLTPYYELQTSSRLDGVSSLAIDHSNSEVIRYFKRMPLDWLIGRLKNTQLVENGYTQRDLALATLIDTHYFDLERALMGSQAPSQRRSIVYGKYKDGRSAELVVYPGLTEKQYESIVSFATRERWPLASRGLFNLLKKDTNPPQTLVDTFLMTPEFQSVEMLFARSEIPVEKKQLLELLTGGDWNHLQTFYEAQRKVQDVSAARRQSFLLDYIDRKSVIAAYLILQTDPDYALRKLDDAHVVKLLELIETKSPEAERFAQNILTSPRSDEVWKLAATRLYQYSGEMVSEGQVKPAPLVRLKIENPIKEAGEKPAATVALAAPPITPPPVRPVEKTAPKAVAVAIAKPLPPTSVVKTDAPSKQRQHTVERGDTLWKIASKYKVDVQNLKSCNKLESDTLRPGKTLKIP